MKPSKHKMTVLSQIFKLIPRNLIPKLANEFGIDRAGGVEQTLPSNLRAFGQMPWDIILALVAQKLIDEGYIIKEPYREITLTSEGIKAANELYTPSVILQDFLENRVGVERKNAENDSVAIVSQISEDALDKLVSFALQSTTNG